jgi:hypothetical protein
MLVNELVIRALRRGANPGVDTPDFATMRDAIDRLNEMLEGWKLDGIDLRQPTLAIGDEVYIDQAHVKAVVDSLAVELLRDHGFEVSGTVYGVAEAGKDQLRVALFEMDDLAADTALTSRRYSWGT